MLQIMGIKLREKGQQKLERATCFKTVAAQLNVLKSSVVRFVGGKRRFSNRLAATLRDKFHVFVACFSEHVAQTSAIGDLHAQILSVCLPQFRVYFACYPPESFRIVCLTCIRFTFVDTSFHYSQNRLTKIPRDSP